MSAPATSLQLDSSIIQAQNVSILSQTNIYQAPANSPRQDLMDLLRENVAFGALYNSAERFDPPKCHPETRTAILDHIDHWAQDVSDNTKPILWLTGAAGAGKSAIVQTLVERWNERGMIAIAFFFWHTSSQRNQKTYLIPTLAFQLLEHFPCIKTRIEAEVNCGGLFKRNLSFQLEKLVIQPLLNIPERPPVIVVIDGLDECCVDLPKTDDFEGRNYEYQQREILEGVATACQKVGALRVMIASRPERQIRESFVEGYLQGHTSPISLNNAVNAGADVQRFVEYKLKEIRQRHHIDPTWPSKTQISRLVEKSSGQFIYPSIAMKHISRPRASPVESLNAVLELQPGSSDSPLVELDMLYTLVLKSVAAKSLAVVIDVLGHIIADERVAGAILNDGSSFDSPSRLEQFFFLAQGEVYFHLTDLHSVLDIPLSPHKSIRIMHATFSEYLQDESRSGDFFISKESTCHRWALISLRHIQGIIRQRNYDTYRPQLIAKFTTWLLRCQPFKDLLDVVWSMMQTYIGPYSSLSMGFGLKSVFSDYGGLENLIAEAGKNNLRDLIEEWNTRLHAAGGAEINMVWEFGQIIRYLQKCNIQEIEPSCWRRYIVRRRLKSAKRRIKKEVTL